MDVPTQLRARPARHGGFTLVELLVAISIGIFLVGGVLTLVQTTRRTSMQQTALSGLQDSERLAMTLIGDVVQAAGYYPNPTAFTAGQALPAVAPFTQAGQGLYGVSAAGPGGDSITVRYQTTGGDQVLNCIGTTNNLGVGVTHVYVNAFSADGNGNLTCSLDNAPPVVLASGVQSLQILYGVQTLTNNCVDSYLTAAQVTAGNYWPNVCSVQITLTLNNPLYKAGNAAQPQFIQFQRVVGVMAKSGVNT